MLLYIGPGIGMATIVIVGIIVALVVASLVIVLIRPIKRWIASLRGMRSEK